MKPDSKTIESHLVELHLVFAHVMIYNLPSEMPKLRSKTYKKEKKRGVCGGYHHRSYIQANKLIVISIGKEARDVGEEAV